MVVKLSKLKQMTTTAKASVQRANKHTIWIAATYCFCST